MLWWILLSWFALIWKTKPAGISRATISVLTPLLLLVFGCCASWPATEVKTVVLPSRTHGPVTIRFLRATRIIPLPLVGYGPLYVETDYGRELIHLGAFGEGAGPLLVSPDGKVAVIECWFEGGQIGVVEIDLDNPRPIFRQVQSPAGGDWEAYEWQPDDPFL